MFRNIKTGKKILILISIAIFFMITIGLTGFLYMNKMAQNSSEMYENRLIPVKQMQSIQINLRKADTYVMEMMLTEDLERTKSLIGNLQTISEENASIISEYEKGRSNYVLGRLAEYKELTAQYDDKMSIVTEAALNNMNKEAYTDYSEEMKPLRKEIDAIVTELTSYNQKQADELNSDNEKGLKQSTLIMLGITLVSIVVCGIIGLYISRMVVQPIKEIQEKMRLAERGDLSVTSSNQSKDEIGMLSQSFNTMMKGIRGVVSHIQENSLVLAASSEELMASADHTSKATEHIVENIQEVAASAENQMNGTLDMSGTMKDMAQLFRDISTRTQEVTGTSAEASSNAEEGIETIQVTIKQMNLIHQTITDLSEIVDKLESRSDQIEEITSVISSIASQTHLLSLNASIEAARAGEQGKGFAVVAAEVGKLAEQSQTSAQKIESLIQTIQGETRNMAGSMVTVTKEVQEGLRVVDSAGQSFEHIQNSTQNVALQLQEVYASTQEMSEKTEKILGIVADIEESSKETAAGTQNISSATEEQLATMEQISATTTSLAEMAEDMQQNIKRFIV
jgi:methyl-accepting chemotaxis protein